MKPIKFRALILTAALAATPALAMIPLAGSAKAASAFPVVIELFTSQGCSSCPPADALLGKLAKRADAVCLTLPVDYWDHLGWKDTLASPANSKRQWAYARSRGDRSVYTPQVVVNGIAHVTTQFEACSATLRHNTRRRKSNCRFKRKCYEITSQVGGSTTTHKGASVETRCWASHMGELEKTQCVGRCYQSAGTGLDLLLRSFKTSNGASRDEKWIWSW